MNNTVSGIVGFILGAAVSGIAVYIYQDKRLSKKFEEELKIYQKKDNITEDVNTTQENTTNDETTEPEGDTMKKTNVPEDALEAAKKMQEGIKRDKENRENRDKIERSKTNYSKLTRNYRGADDEKGGKENMTMSEKIVNNKPYYITVEEFYEMDGKDGYKAIDLFYNGDDDSVCNESGEILEDAWMSIGWDIQQDLFDGKTDDEIYVRNDEFKEVYCIAKNFMP